MHAYTLFTFMVIRLCFPFLENFAMGKDLEIGMTSKRDLQLEHGNDLIKPASTGQNSLLKIGSSKYDKQIKKGQLTFSCESPSSKLNYDGATITGANTNTTDRQMESTQFEASNRHFMASDISNAANNNADELPSLELSLKRLRGVKDTETTVQDDRNVLRRSDSSAFSRYIDLEIISCY